MEIYLVGGAVRDALLGLPVNDRDWVVVGSTPGDMVAQGYLPVGRDFPVFLHPVSHEEYALARTERKTRPGFRGFAIHASPEVTLEEDLARRDLTINSIAARGDFTRPEGQYDLSPQHFKLNSSQLIDPFGGQTDVRDKVLRHVTPAFREDPVRILRVARFNARFPDFSVAPETLGLMREMVASGEVNALVPERVWQELSEGLMAAQPSKMMGVLVRTGALHHVLPPLLPGVDAEFLVLDAAAQAGASLAVRFACLMSHFEPDPALMRRIPGACSELAALWAREHEHLSEFKPIADARADFDAVGNRGGVAGTVAQDLVQLFERCDAFRKPGRFFELLQCCSLLRGMDTRQLNGALRAAQTVTSQQALIGFAAKGCQGIDASGPEIAAAMRLARVAAVAHFLA